MAIVIGVAPSTGAIATIGVTQFIGAIATTGVTQFIGGIAITIGTGDLVGIAVGGDERSQALNMKKAQPQCWALFRLRFRLPGGLTVALTATREGKPGSSGD